MDTILYVDIPREDGLYKFENKNIFPNIPENIRVNTPFFNEENSLEELVEIIAEEEDTDIVFSCNDQNYPLVRELGKILTQEYQRTVYIVNAGFRKEYCVRQEKSLIYLLRDYQQLNRVDDIAFEVVENMEDFLTGLEHEAEYTPGYYNAMKNGYVAFMTGIYPENLSNTLAKHILLEDDEIAGHINEYLDVNGAVFTKKEPNEAKDMIQHIHQVKEDEICLDDSSMTIRQMVCSYKQFSSWKEAGKVSADISYFLKIEDGEDLECFARDLETFQKEGMIDTLDRRIVDECRWTGECSLKRLTRYEVSDGKLKPCLTSEKTLGEIGTDSYRQKIEANRICDKTMIQRNCNECSVKNKCSKCACVSEGIGASDYCEFMHKYPFVGEYLKQSQVAHFLSCYSRIFAGKDSVKFSCSRRGLKYPANHKVESETKPLFLFENDGKYYYLELRQGSLIHVEEKYVFLLEAWALGEPKEAIVENMQETFRLTRAQAEMLVEEGMHRLKNGGMIV